MPGTARDCQGLPGVINFCNNSTLQDMEIYRGGHWSGQRWPLLPSSQLFSKNSHNYALFIICVITLIQTQIWDICCHFMNSNRQRLRRCGKINYKILEVSCRSCLDKIQDWSLLSTSLKYFDNCHSQVLH